MVRVGARSGVRVGFRVRVRVDVGADHQQPNTTKTKSKHSIAVEAARA